MDAMIQKLEEWITSLKKFLLPLLVALMAANIQYPVIDQHYLGIVAFIVAALSGLSYTNQQNKLEKEQDGTR